MKVMGVELQDNKVKREDAPKVKALNPSMDKDAYPEIRVGKAGYNNVSVDLDGCEAGQKCLLVCVVNVKEIVERKSQSEGKTDEECNGTLEILEAGLKPYGDDKLETDSKSEDVARKVNKILDAIEE
jgi:hypothetical protein